MKKIALSVSVILMALCLVISCESTPNLTVSFDTDGGSTIAPVSVAPGKTVAEPVPPTKTGYQFVEWQLEGVKFNFDTVIEENITLKAIWKQVFTVTFYTDGGSAIEPVTVTEGETISQPADPKKSCWNFTQWKLGDEAYNFEAAVTENIELKAIWAATDAVWNGETADTKWFDNAEEGTTEYKINTAAELAGLAELVNRTKNHVDFSGKTVTLMNDLDLNSKNWTPIGNTDTATLAFNGTFDGAGHTIWNLKVDSSANTGDEYASGLFGWGYTDAHFKNLTIDGADVLGHHYVAAVVGYIYGTIDNCHVKNATITNTHANDKACGDKTGAIVGYYPAENKVITNCSATDCSISGSRDAGQLVGAGLKTCVDEKCKANNVSVKTVENDTCSKTGTNINERLVGRHL